MTSDKFYSSKRVEGPFDVIVVGSGMSGLACAAMLSEAGKRVLVLEQHYQPGGYTHTFTRKNYEWDVGIHYVGTALETSTWYRQLSALSGGAIRLEPFKGNLDELYFPDFHIRIPQLYEDYQNTLIEKFPDEAEGIRTYIQTIQYMRSKLQTYYAMNLLPKPLTRFARKTFVRRAHQLATSTTEQVMDECGIRDDRLKAVIDAQWGNIGAPRQYCSFLVHSAMLGNYMESGAAYPYGGSTLFARELGRVIYRNGSAIRVKAPVQKVLISDNRATGVMLEDGEKIHAPLVISSNGVFNTYFKFLNEQASCQEAIAEIKKMQPAYEYINLFIGFKQSPTDFGLGNGNTWIHPNWNSTDTDPTWDITNLEANPHPKVLFFSSSSLRDPDQKNRKHSGWNGQIVSAVKYGSFDKWKGTRWKHRPDDYYAFKDQISEKLMTLLDEKYPGIRDNVDHMELGTTLTYDHFCASYNGIPYGLAPVPNRYESLLPRPMTPVKNLLICGQDLIMPGVPAAVGSANLACSIVLRKNIGNYWAKQAKNL